FPSQHDSAAMLAEGLFIRRNFLTPAALLRVLDAIGRLSTSWESSEELDLLGRGQTGQIRAVGIAAQSALDEIRAVLAPAALNWARACGFWFPRAPHLQLFPVRMVGDD